MKRGAYTAVIFCYALFAGLVYGCAKNLEAGTPQTGEQTLKALIDRRDSTVNWMLDVNPLKTPQDLVAVPITTATIFASRTQTQTVYPELAGFGSLDTSLLSEHEMRVLTPFCAAIVAADKTQASTFMNAANTFLLTVFFDDVRGAAFLQNYIIGRPDIRGNIWQIPVRFFLKGAHLDMRIFLNQGSQGALETQSAHAISSITPDNGQNALLIDQIAYGEVINDNNDTQ
jgi:hypothetical protein